MKKILIVEDEISIAEIERDYLEANGYSVTLALTGNEGLSNALNHDYSLIVLDIMLPDTDGFAICRELRKAKQTPVMFVTARMDDIDKVRAFGMGADDYIVKPFSFYEFIARVGAHIARFETLTETKEIHNEFQVKGIKMNVAARTVYVNGNEAVLPNKEFELLSFFLQNPDEVFSKEQLLNRVWGVDAFVELNTVTVHVNRLREKIEEDPANPTYIQTVWGVGYKLSL